MISIAGGVYAERCKYPAWDQIYGSGLRAAIAVSSLSDRVHLHAYVPGEWMDDVKTTLASFGILETLRETRAPQTFQYLHTLALSVRPDVSSSYPDLVVEDEVVLRFGMLEGDARVKGDRVVYDPQSPNASYYYNGSTAGSLAMIVRYSEIPGATAARAKGASSDEAGPLLPDEDDLIKAVVAQRDLSQPPQIVLVKDGFGGVTVFQGDQPTRIPSYAAESFFRIGSGDVTAAAFAHAWGELGWDPVDAAHYAARCAAYFVEGPRLPLPNVAEVADRMPNQIRPGKIRIVGLGDFEQHVLVLTTEAWLRHLGGTVEHVTFGLDDLDSRVQECVDLLLVGARCSRFELEAAARAGLRPTVIFWPSAHADFSRHYFPSAIVARDYATALYHVMRSPAR